MEVMFSHLGWSEIVVLAIVGLVVFGPERLPKVARDAVTMLRQLRTMARGAASDLRAELGPEMADLDLASMHPRRLIGSILDEDDNVPAPLPVAELSTATLAPGETPPYDVEAT